ncbi:hypothetical protein ABT354_32785 [Streptomyces sp. NPDC000594]|uniref:hypothetical protein n=1 Tax=Streptomyces sp. NPDC000594 TaxID=3154261 RepID=UPI0033288473
MRVSPALALVLLLAGLTACTGDEDTRPSPAQSTRAEPSPAASPGHGSARGMSFTVAATVRRADAVPIGRPEQRPYERPFRSASDLGQGRTAAGLDLTADGRLITSSDPKARTVDGRLRIGQSRMGLQTADGFTPFPPAPRGSCRNKGPRQAPYADEQNGVVAWAETTTTNLYRFDWCVFAHHPRTGRTTLLGDSHTLTRGKPMPEAQDGSGLSLGTDTAYWATAHPLPGKKNAFGTRIVAAPLTARTPGFHTVVERAKLPQALGKSLFYVRTADVTPELRKDRFEIHRLDPGGTDTVVAHGTLAKGQSVSTLAVSKDRITWTIATHTRTSGLLYSLDLRTNRALTIALGHSAPATMALRATDRFLAWGGADEGDAGQYLYDLPRNKLWRLGSQPGYSVAHAAGDHVAWAKLSQPKRGPGTSTYTVARWK